MRPEAFSAGEVLEVNDAVTTVHVEPAAVVGRRRGALVYFHVVNNTGAAITATITVGSGVSMVVIRANSVVPLTAWVAGGATLSVQTSGANLGVYGHVVASA